jgi:cathepsin F
MNRANSQGDIEASPSDIGLSVDQGMVATPTIILLPYGRMLVVDGSVFAQLQADTSGLDLIELGENVVQAQERPTPTITLNSLADSTPSILDVDSETNSKDGCITPTLGGLLPPTYESIFGSENMADLPPSYDEILQQLQAQEVPETTPEEYQAGEIRESRV